MFVYFLQRWLISRRFEKVDSGYIYRRRPDLPGFALSDEERLATMREFRRRYVKSWLMMIAAFFAASIAVVLVAVFLNLGEDILQVAVYALAILFVAYVLKEQRGWSLLPEKRFENRPRVPSSLPTDGWFFRYRALSQRRSWSVYAVLIVLYGTLLWFVTPRTLDVTVVHWFLFAGFAMSFGVLVFGAVLKARGPLED